MYFSKIKTLFCFFTLFAFYLTYKCVRSFCLTLYYNTQRPREAKDKNFTHYPMSLLHNYLFSPH